MSLGMDVLPNQTSRQDVRQQQTQVLSAGQLESLRLLEASTLDLRTELQQKLLENPVIEDVVDRSQVSISDFAPDEFKGETPASSAVELDFTPTGTAAEAVLGAQDGCLDYFLGNMESASGDEESITRKQRLFDSVHEKETLQDHLLAQVPLSTIEPQDRPIAEALIADVDDDGRYVGSIPDVQMVTGAHERRIFAVLTRILKFDPTGCCARNLEECLLAQLDKLDDSPWQNDVRKIIVSGALPDVALGKVEQVSQFLGIDSTRWNELIQALRTLNPRPGRDRRFVSSADFIACVKPEVFAVRQEGKWVARVDPRATPEIRISQKYLVLAEDEKADPEARAYAIKRIGEVRELQKALDGREETIRVIAQAAFDAQPDFFTKGIVGLRPLTRTEIARQVGRDDSTVSRTVRSKWVRTPFGVLPLSRFFPVGQIQTGEGCVISSEPIKEALRRIIAEEDPHNPFSDEMLVSKLGAQGFKVARRTIAKYRDALKVPSAAKRRL